MILIAPPSATGFFFLRFFLSPSAGASDWYRCRYAWRALAWGLGAWGCFFFSSSRRRERPWKREGGVPWPDIGAAPPRS